LNFMSNRPTVTEIFNRALEIRAAAPAAGYDEIRRRLLDEFGSRPLPETAYLTIPEYDNVVPEEDWTAGLPIVLRGIQNNDWNDVVDGIIISLEQIENYPKESLREDDPRKQWHNRDRGIEEAEAKVIEKWMPDDLMKLARRNTGSR
ncbi:hypothetical protein OFB92_26720, partial [Escherichia coli]|nr:hypothetical protein [Escherichia coli]